MSPWGRRGYVTSYHYYPWLGTRWYRKEVAFLMTATQVGKGIMEGRNCKRTNIDERIPMSRATVRLGTTNCSHRLATDWGSRADVSWGTPVIIFSLKILPQRPQLHRGRIVWTTPFLWRGRQGNSQNTMRGKGPEVPLLHLKNIFMHRWMCPGWIKRERRVEVDEES